MKKIIILISIALFVCSGAFAAKPKTFNIYGMALVLKEGAAPILPQAKKINELYGIDAYALEDPLTPYNPKGNRIFDTKVGMIQTKEFVYKVCRDGRELSIAVDMALDQSKPAPVLFCIHGGAWMKGNNKSYSGMSKSLAKNNGITCVRIQYSLVNDKNGVMFQDMIDDCRDAVKYVIKHAKELNVNPKSLGFIGSSAGGHLAAATALNFNSRTKVLVGWYGPYDLPLLETIYAPLTGSALAKALKNCDEAYMKSVSPQYMIKSRVKFASLLLQGGCDTTVPAASAPNFAKALKEHGAKVAEVVMYPYGTHSLSAGIYGRDLNEKTLEYLEKYLR